MPSHVPSPTSQVSSRTSQASDFRFYNVRRGDVQRNFGIRAELSTLIWRFELAQPFLDHVQLRLQGGLLIFERLFFESRIGPGFRAIIPASSQPSRQARGPKHVSPTSASSPIHSAVPAIPRSEAAPEAASEATSYGAISESWNVESRAESGCAAAHRPHSRGTGSISSWHNNNPPLL
jgi:hypothetical protein